MNKRGLMFTLTAVFLVMVILTTFLIQASNITKTNIETSSIRTKTTNSFMDSLINNYLPDALEMTVINNPSIDYLNLKIEEIQEFASNTGIGLTYQTSDLIITPTQPNTYDASFVISFTIINNDIEYQEITQTIRVENIVVIP